MVVMRKNYTAEEKAAVLRTSLTGLARALGYTPVRKGNYYSLKEMDSVMIKEDSIWFRNSRIHSGAMGGKGGTQIDFMLQFGNCSTVPEAVHEILNMNHLQIISEREIYVGSTVPSQLQLPEKATGYKRLYAYLCKLRKLSPEVVHYFTHEQAILYESKDHHNLVFLGKDKEGSVRYATLRGTSDVYGKKFKGDVRGSNKNYGVNIVNFNSSVVKVFESNIDCMSYIDLTGDTVSNKLILGMLNDRPLLTFLNEYNHIAEIDFCMDNDEPARNAVLGTDRRQIVNGIEVMVHIPGLIEKYSAAGYIVKDCPAETGKGKDYNENLQYYRENNPNHIIGIKELK